MNDRSGDRLRDYRLVSLVGRGGFADVYQAQHLLTQRITAVKIIHSNFLNEHDQLQRFKSEAQLVSSLNHPNIVQLYEFWLDEAGAYIAMEWMEGGSLRDRLAQTGRQNPGMVMDILAQIAPALALVHRNQIIHRDLKPANILFDHEGVVHLADFGLAKWHGTLYSLPDEGGAIGTPEYMAPDQVTRDLETELLPQSDIYSLGIILFELLTGQHPFGSGDTISMLLRHVRDPMPLMRDQCPDIPEALDAVVQKATAKTPDARYENVLSLAEAFHSALGQGAARSFLAQSTGLTPVIEAVGEFQAYKYERAGEVVGKPRQLIGRTAVITIVNQWLERNERVLLHGMGGIGKTAIAAAIAEAYLESEKGAVIWIEAGKQDADAIFEALAHELGQAGEIASKGGNDRVVAIRKLLLEQDALLVVDNIWNEDAVLPLIQAVPHNMPMLLTSRTAISIDGAMIGIEPLEDEPALNLLQHYSHKDFTTDDLARQLCSLLGNHPYALEMAAKRLQMHRHLSPERLIKEISAAPHHGVVSTGALGTGRQRSVKDLLDDSVAELTDELRSLLVMLGGFFTSKASLDLLERVVESDKKMLFGALLELERRGLVSLTLDDTGMSHYRMHDLTYSYATSLFSHEYSDRGTVIAAVQQFVIDNDDNLDALDFEIVNILRAARAAYHAGNEASLIAIMRHLTVEARYLTRRGSSAAIDLVRAAINAAEKAGDFEAAHYMSGRLGNVYFQINAQYDLAVEAYTQALDFARKMGDLSREAILLSLVATARFKAGMDHVEAYFEQASDVAEKASDPEVEAKIFNHRSFYVNELSPPDFAASLEYCNRAIEIARNNELSDILISTLINRAVCETKMGRLEDALQSDLEAYHLAEEVESRYWICFTSKQVGEDYHHLGERDAAGRYLKRSLQLSHQINDTTRAASILEIARQYGYEL